MKLISNKEYDKLNHKSEIDKLIRAMILIEELGCYITDIQSDGKLINKARKESK